MSDVAVPYQRAGESLFVETLYRRLALVREQLWRARQSEDDVLLQISAVQLEDLLAVAAAHDVELENR